MMSHSVSKKTGLAVWALVLVILGATGLFTNHLWLPSLQGLIASTAKGSGKSTGGHGHGHGGHGDHAPHTEGGDGDSLELTAQGLKNVGYRPIRVELGTYVKTVSLPAMVVERPGRSQIEVTAPFTGIVTKIHPIEGEAISPGQPLFELRLTHEDLVTSQRDYLRSVEELDLVKLGIKRLESISDGVIAGKRILEKKYEKNKIEAGLRAQRQGLLLHGLSAQQIDNILEARELLQSLTVSAPTDVSDCQAAADEHLYHLQDLRVNAGQQVTAGESLGVLADHCQLYLEGKAFEEDAERLNRAAQQRWKIAAVTPTGGRASESASGLEILYLADRVHEDSRAFHFYVGLPNEVIRDQKSGHHRFIAWKFRPGQRMEIRVPVERLEKRIVLPVDAVVDEGAESYVYQANGKRFDRVAVHVEMRDQESVVIANDGSLYPGDVIAAAGAYQMHLALKNQVGGGVDPHAGHTH